MPPPAPSPARPEMPATPAERRMLVGIVAFFALALLAVVWMLSARVVTRYAMTCDRAASACTLTRHHLVGSETYAVRVPAGARAEVRVTPWKAKAKPRTYLELVAPGERIFLIEYEDDRAVDRASEAARRLNAFLGGDGPAVHAEIEGSPRPTWAILALVAVVTVGGVAASRAVTARWALGGTARAA